MASKGGITGGLAGSLARQLAPRALAATPALTSAFVREALTRAIEGVGPLPAAARAAEASLRHHRDVEHAIDDVVEAHVRYAGAQGFVTNIGGLVTAAVAVPANLTGLALVQCRMIAGIAHLRGYELDDPRVRNAVLASLLGRDGVDRLVRRQRLPAPPMALATAPVHDPDADRLIAAEVAADLVAQVAGKRLAVTVGRRVPVLGGVVGLSADAYATWRLGRYAGEELLPRARR